MRNTFLHCCICSFFHCGIFSQTKRQRLRSKKLERRIERNHADKMLPTEKRTDAPKPESRAISSELLQVLNQYLPDYVLLLTEINVIL